ncbi:cytochrome-c peroxidase [Confluentibacter sediminis]|uniref:cytochrome-c peroxidase n=1 Tax=Confluentibacter sediminis TaxID=2219045 RepID=UPI000DAD1835|nr:cytochrome c peroxidase [Confluentibacter sediminis]
MKLSATILGFLLLLSTSCKKKEVVLIPAPDWSFAQNFYLEHLTRSIAYLDSLKAEGFDGAQSKLFFIKAREAFKMAEPYASYLNPEVGHRANGPALPVYKDDSGTILKPVGFQKIEESIYEGETSQADFDNEMFVTKGMLTVLKKGLLKRDLNAQRFFIATHQQLFRIVSLGISGFDTPVSHLGLQESKLSLESLQTVYVHTLQPLILNTDKSLDTDFQNSLSNAILFIERHPDFETFDRFTFTRDYMNPITRQWVAIRKVSNLWEPSTTEPFNYDAPTFFEKNTFNVGFFTPATNKNPTEKQIALGEKLFFDANLSANGSMACATCHIPSKGYADGMALNSDNKGHLLQRNTPTLINTVFQQSFFLDGRSNSLLDQISMVFTNDNEFNTNVHEFSDAILKDSTYIQLFKEAYGGVSKTNKDVIKAISSYISTLHDFDSKFDKNMRGEVHTFTEDETLGYTIFMGKGLCATCHFIPLTNGTVPPFFNETEKEVIGVPDSNRNLALDDDLGFYWKYEEALHKGMFKTPTLRQVSMTAPYMHNGIYNSLEEVVDFYNKGGGGGLGFDLEHQTLPFDELKLSAGEQKALVAFLKTL